MDDPQSRAIEVMKEQTKSRLEKIHYDIACAGLDYRRKTLVDVLATISQLAAIAPEETAREMQVELHLNGRSMAIPERLRELRKNYEDFGVVLDLLTTMIEPYDSSPS